MSALSRRWLMSSRRPCLQRSFADLGACLVYSRWIWSWGGVLRYQAPIGSFPCVFEAFVLLLAPSVATLVIPNPSSRLYSKPLDSPSTYEFPTNTSKNVDWSTFSFAFCHTCVTLFHFNEKVLMITNLPIHEKMLDPLLQDSPIVHSRLLTTALHLV